MELLDFLNEHKSTWRAILSSPPYNLEIREESNYVLLKYNMIESDFSLVETRQARGAIFYHDPSTGGFIPQSIAMFKFFNSNETYAETANIDWTTARVLEKCDGSLIRISYDKRTNNFLISTNGTIFARNALTPFGNSYEDAFIETIGGAAAYSLLLSKLNHDYTYFFELVSKYNRICVSYKEDAIYYLGRRNMITLKEELPNDLDESLNLKFPREYHLNSYEECEKAIQELGENQEGFCVCDANFRRIKMKTPWYITTHHLRVNGVLTTTKIISMYQDDSLDDFLAYFPENAPQVDEVIKKLHDLQEKVDITYEVVKGAGKRRDFALHVQSYIKPIQSYLFARLDNKVTCAQTYFKQMKAKNLAELLNVKEIGI